MEAFFFGSSAHSLFGVYHPPSTGGQNNKAVLLCGPVAQEAIRTHKALRFLATQLSDAGFHVLRFDYRGQGDSAGDMKGVTPAHWQEDILTAVQELSDISMATHISVLGVRMGGLLAGTLKSLPAKVKQLLLWDPCVTGDVCSAELQSIGKLQADATEIAINGFLLPANFLSGLSSLSLLDPLVASYQQVDLVVSHQSDEFDELHQRLSAQTDCHFCLSPAPHDWSYVDNEGGILWPISIMQSLLQRLVRH